MFRYPPDRSLKWNQNVSLQELFTALNFSSLFTTSAVPCGFGSQAISAGLEEAPRSFYAQAVGSGAGHRGKDGGKVAGPSLAGLGRCFRGAMLGQERPGSWAGCCRWAALSSVPKSLSVLASERSPCSRALWDLGWQKLGWDLVWGCYQPSHPKMVGPKLLTQALGRMGFCFFEVSPHLKLLWRCSVVTRLWRTPGLALLQRHMVYEPATSNRELHQQRGIFIKWEQFSLVTSL